MRSQLLAVHQNLGPLLGSKGVWRALLTFWIVLLLLSSALAAESSNSPRPPVERTPLEGYLYTGEQIDPDLGMYYLRARYFQPATGRFWTMDSYEGRQEESLSLHKYLYGNADPVNQIDPSGYSSTSAAEIGKKVHKAIAEDFKRYARSSASGSAVSTILSAGSGGSFSAVVNLFPDLVDSGRHEIYEIKPNSVANFILGEAQLEGYLQVLQHFDPASRWHRGQDYRAPLRIDIGIPLKQVVTQPTVAGIILYSVIDIRDLIKNAVKNDIKAKQAQLDTAFQAATLTSMLGGF